MNIRRFETYPRLATALTVTFLLCGLLLVLLLLTRVSNHIARFENQIQSELVSTGARGIRHVFTLSIEREWRGLRAIATSEDLANIEKARHLLDDAKEVGNGISWAAFVDLRGTIVAGSDRLGEGTDVSEKKWFQDSLTSGRLYTRQSVPGEDTLEFLQMTQPVLVSTGQVIGVITYIFTMEWGNSLISEASKEFGVEAVIVDSENNVLLDSRSDSVIESDTDTGDQSVTRLLHQPANEIKIIDGMVINATPAMVSRSLPYFDGHLIVQAPSSIGNGTVTSFTNQMAFWITGALAIATLVPIVLVTHFVRPIERLASTANNLADGVFDYPEERCFTRESAILSASLARLQSRLKRGQDSKPDLEIQPFEASLKHRRTSMNAPLLNRRFRILSRGLAGKGVSPPAVKTDTL